MAKYITLLFNASRKSPLIFLIGATNLATSLSRLFEKIIYLKLPDQ